LLLNIIIIPIPNLINKYILLCRLNLRTFLFRKSTILINQNSKVLTNSLLKLLKNLGCKIFCRTYKNTEKKKETINNMTSLQFNSKNKKLKALYAQKSYRKKLRVLIELFSFQMPLVHVRSQFHSVCLMF
jgi:hypothetical protein